MHDLSIYQAKRDALVKKHLRAEQQFPERVNCAGTGGIDHLAMISSDLERTIEFYTNVLGMTVTNIIQNRDEPSSTHIFLDMGGGTSMAFFDFPKHGDALSVRGIGAMHHVALKATSSQYQSVIANLKSREHKYDIVGDEKSGSVYFRDPDHILLEVRVNNKDLHNK